MEPIDSPFFKLSIPMTRRGLAITDSRIAPGMEVCYTVTFSSRERLRDYNYDLVCVTEREKFVVPIRARGVRPSLTMGDALSFGVAAVKTSVTKAFVVRGCAPHRPCCLGARQPFRTVVKACHVISTVRAMPCPRPPAPATADPQRVRTPNGVHRVM